jgi:ParB family chromosome partitioning protein
LQIPARRIPPALSQQWRVKMSEQIVAIPLGQLVRSKANMRRVDRHTDIAQLAENIAAVGLLENLVVQLAPAEGNAMLKYEVVAGGRRLAALERLAKTGKIASTYAVPCRVIQDASAEALTEISLAENFQRVPAHPADQFDAFAKLHKSGSSAATIASRFGIAKTFVEQRLKLASVSPRLLAVYRKGEMSLEQLTTFTINEDRALQEKVWFENPYSDLAPSAIRRLLTQSAVEADERRARFIGAKAYQKAGGTIVRDLFDAENEGYFADSQLLDRLVAEKLKQTADALGAEGWSWVEVRTDADFSYLRSFRRLAASETALLEADEQRLSALGDRYDALIAELEDAENSEASEELDRIDAEMAKLQSAKAVWTAEDKARSGVLVGLDFDGTVSLTLGLIRGDDEDGAAETTVSSARKEKDGYPESVQLDLSAHRTAALRASVLGNPDLAYLLLLDSLVRQIFGGGAPDCLEIRVTEVSLDRASQTVGESEAMEALSKQHAYWSEKRAAAKDGWKWICKLSESQRHKLMAYCVAASVNALRLSGHQREGVDQLAALAGLDMADWWKVDSSFFQRLSKVNIQKAIQETAGSIPKSRYEGLGKSELARFAEKTASGWLPQVFRKERPPIAEAAK